MILWNAEGRQSPMGVTCVIIYINNNKTYKFVGLELKWKFKKDSLIAIPIIKTISVFFTLQNNILLELIYIIYNK